MSGSDAYAGHAACKRCGAEWPSGFYRQAALRGCPACEPALWRNAV